MGCGGGWGGWNRLGTHTTDHKQLLEPHWRQLTCSTSFSKVSSVTSSTQTVGMASRRDCIRSCGRLSAATPLRTLAELLRRAAAAQGARELICACILWRKCVWLGTYNGEGAGQGDSVAHHKFRSWRSVQVSAGISGALDGSMGRQGPWRKFGGMPSTLQGT